MSIDNDEHEITEKEEAMADMVKEDEAQVMYQKPKRTRRKINYKTLGLTTDTTIITIGKREGNNMVAPTQRITIEGMRQSDVLAFVIDMIAMSLSKFGTLDVSKWEKSPKE